MYYNVIIKKIEHLECSPTGYLRFNLICCIDSGYTFIKIRNCLNQHLINQFCKCKVGDLINVFLRKPIDGEYIFEDKPDFICEELNFCIN